MAHNVKLRKPSIKPEVAERGRRAADLLRPHIGSYVARLNGEILTSADTPGDVLTWLRERQIKGAVVFLVPVDPVAATNVA